jgi:DNA-binding NarL/FixJ family response regulator
MKVLIVDDNPAIRGAVRNLLETDPIFQICGEAENDREAIQRTAELRPELIIMDLSMPVLNGLDAALDKGRGSLGGYSGGSTKK